MGVACAMLATALQGCNVQPQTLPLFFEPSDRGVRLLDSSGSLTASITSPISSRIVMIAPDLSMAVSFAEEGAGPATQIVVMLSAVDGERALVLPEGLDSIVWAATDGRSLLALKDGDLLQLSACTDRINVSRVLPGVRAFAASREMLAWLPRGSEAPRLWWRRPSGGRDESQPLPTVFDVVIPVAADSVVLARETVGTPTRLSEFCLVDLQSRTVRTLAPPPGDWVIAAGAARESDVMIVEVWDGQRVHRDGVPVTAFYKWPLAGNRGKRLFRNPHAARILGDRTSVFELTPRCR